MQENNKDILAQRLLAAVDLMEFGIALMRQNIVRKNAGAPSYYIDCELERWLMEQPPLSLNSSVADRNI